ncbi:MAG: hypothetical protein KJ601_05680 [Nanoarchaeota archaeon]|nr:hypothetical protein [Nanoarchaeota archaeon]
MVRFRCNNCNYVFTPKVRDKTPDRCPYCSEFKSLMEERSILDSVGIDDEMEE